MKVKNVHHLFEVLKSHGYKASNGSFSFDVRQFSDYHQLRLLRYPPSYVIDFLYEISETECPERNVDVVVPEIYNKVFPNCDWYRIQSGNRKVHGMLIPTVFFQDMRDKLDFLLK